MCVYLHSLALKRCCHVQIILAVTKLKVDSESGSHWLCLGAKSAVKAKAIDLHHGDRGKVG